LHPLEFPLILGLWFGTHWASHVLDLPQAHGGTAVAAEVVEVIALFLSRKTAGTEKHVKPSGDAKITIP
jgi:hypothetical protein